MPNGSDRIFDCIVLGAGIAGVTAARDLRNKGLDVLLVEGSDRIGGRMYSRRDVVPQPGEPGKFLPIEAGAEYIHVVNRQRYKDFWSEIDRQGFTTSKFPKTTIFHKTGTRARNRVFFPGWEHPLTTDEVLQSDKEIQPASAMLFLLELRDLFDPDKSQDIAAGVFSKSLGYKGRGHTITEYTLSAHTPGILDVAPAGHPEGEPNPNDTISVAGIIKDEIQDQLMEPAELRLEVDRPGEPRICGYDTLPRKICDELVAGGGVLALSSPGTTDHKVTRVERSDGEITVTTAGGHRFRGRSALSTFSAGMLDPETGEGGAIFGELLDEEKREALGFVKMGAITKLGVAFKERLWGAECADMSVLSNPAGRARTFFSNFPDETDGPHMLTALMMSKDHRAVRELSDADAIQLLLDELQKIFAPAAPRWTAETVLAGERGADGAFRPIYFRQDWEKDPFARGGNSFLCFKAAQPGAKVTVTRAREALKNPRNTLPLFWAGEATAPAYDRRYQPLAVHGAYISGKRAAEDIHHYLIEDRGDAGRFGRYYRKKYLDRGFFERVGDFFGDLFS